MIQCDSLDPTFFLIDQGGFLIYWHGDQSDQDLTFQWIGTTNHGGFERILYVDLRDTIRKELGIRTKDGVRWALRWVPGMFKRTASLYRMTP